MRSPTLLALCLSVSLLSLSADAQVSGRAKRLRSEARDLRDTLNSGSTPAPKAPAAPKAWATPSLPESNVPKAGPSVHKAAGGGQLTELQFLESKGASLTTPDADGNSPLHLAAYRGQTETVRYLVSRPGLLKDPQDKRGQTPLMLAAFSGHAETVQALLEGGCDPKVAAPDGSTALHIAAGQGNLGVVEALLKAGADAAAVDRKGKSASDWASQKRKGEWQSIVDRLKQP